MSFDFKKIRPKKRAPRPLDPEEIFHAATVSDKNINDLWLAQGDALRAWHSARAQSDIAVVLNTGAGKTLVGLLIAQSLANETASHVVFACGSIQLVEQTAEKAAGYGLPVTTYVRREFSNNLYDRGLAPCITTYQALFSGRTRFAGDRIAAAIFDDAHTADSFLRNHFSLSIRRATFGGVYSELLALFRDYFHATGVAASYEELISDDGTGRRATLLVPPYELRRNAEEFTRILVCANFDKNTETLFAWEHVRDHEDLCCVLISPAAITITPPSVPVANLPYFYRQVRRVYLSATLSARDAFARTFGRVPDAIVSPATAAGECERLIVAPAMSHIPRETDIAVVQAELQDRKALLLVPTYNRSQQWSEVAVPPPKDEVAQSVSHFRDSPDDEQEKLILAARYDGIDLPGDTCRVMVIDDLPMGSGPFERYLWETVGLTNSLRTTLASRIVQSFGRISRGMSDHGVVFLTGKALIRWLQLPKNAAALPAFLQKQLLLAHNVSASLQSKASLRDVVNACLGREKEWIEAYTNFMAQAETEDDDPDTELLAKVALAEAKFGVELWNRQYERAAATLNSSIDAAFQVSSSTAAWHSLWLGYALECAGDRESATALYRRAHALQKTLPRMPPAHQEAQLETIPGQVLEIEQQIDYIAGNTVRLPKSLANDLVLLNGAGTVPQTEEALRSLGQYLGFDSSRPEKEVGTGPDVLWVTDTGVAVCMEAKTEKKDTSRYTKEDIGQLLDHVQWVRDNKKVSEVIPIFVGPRLSPSNAANPPDGMHVVELQQFDSLGQRLQTALRDATQDALPIMLRSNLLEALTARHLMWPVVYDELPKAELKEL